VCTKTNPEKLEDSPIVARAAAWLARRGFTMHKVSLCHKPLEQSDVIVAEVVATGPTAAEQEQQHHPQQQRVLVKLVSVPTLRCRISKPDEKWRISASSFANEFGFYAGAPIAHMLSAGVRIPRPLLAERLAPVDAPFMQQEYAFALEYLDPALFRQEPELDEADARRALSYLARFHACFARMPREAFEKLARCLSFAQGGWWRKALRPSVRFDRLPEAFASLIANFGERFLDLDTPTHHACMSWLARNVDWIEERLAPPLPPATKPSGGSTPLCTMVHGDFKTSNVFFSTKSINQDKEEDEAKRGCGDVVTIDFQWVGPARTGASDVAYLLAGGIQWEVIQHDDALIEYYLTQLEHHLMQGIRLKGHVS